MTDWIISSLVFLSLMTLFVVATDGRYFGKRLIFWIYDRFGAAMYSGSSEDARWQQLAGLLDLQGDERILDVGTAVANLPITLAAQPNFQGHVTGLDWSPKMLAAARRRGLSRQVTLVRGDARRPLPFASQSFNVITCLETLETLPHPDQILREIIRTLRPDGILVFSLYKGVLTLTAALSFDWYQKQLRSYGFNLQLVQFRQNYDIIIGQRILNDKMNFDFLEPWKPISNSEKARRYDAELSKEVSSRHILYGINSQAIAYRVDNDDILFAVDVESHQYAVVHLTWSGQEEAAGFPHTTLYTDLNDWEDNCMKKDHKSLISNYP
ncbi:MAG: class I SAM-dependent methyltransferase [Ardenticatenaceae bacterium]|nr:class I SAM-dependent methyltransferase [Ardenticatenaceae bacterium]MCB9444243.1 class I SAM-dependent methyltransferase [Ardenticatenaceae bacterium]